MFIPKPPPHLSDREKAQHPSWRRYTRKYQKKKRLVRDMWIISGILMIGSPVAAVPVLALGTTFVAFIILDETP